MPALVLTRVAREQLAALPPKLATAVGKTLDRLAIDPESIGQPLVGRLAGIWSARVGNYRILFTLAGRHDRRRVIVRSIRHRGAAYRKGRA